MPFVRVPCSICKWNTLIFLISWLLRTKHLFLSITFTPAGTMTCYLSNVRSASEEVLLHLIHNDMTNLGYFGISSFWISLIFLDFNWNNDFNIFSLSQFKLTKITKCTNTVSHESNQYHVIETDISFHVNFNRLLILVEINVLKLDHRVRYLSINVVLHG